MQISLRHFSKIKSSIFLFLTGCSFPISGQGDVIKVQPSVIQGICTACNTSSCASCPKCSSGGCRRDDRDEDRRTCRICSNTSTFCCPLPKRRATEEQTASLELATENRKRNTSTECRGNNLTRCCLGCNSPTSVFIPRSVGANTARELAGWEEFIYQYDAGGYYLTTGHVLGYGCSFRPARIAHMLFGSDVLHIEGSQVPNRSRCALLADNFGLSTTFSGSVTFEPIIENIIFDNQFFIGLDPLLCGLYARIHAPLVHTRWNLHMRECTTSSARSTNRAFPACYMSEESAHPTPTIADALSGRFLFGDMQTPWQYGRFSSGAQTKTALADIDLILGYIPWQSDFFHFGFYGQVVCPTGNKPHAHFIFEPIVGNAKHWELGFGLTGHYVLWERDVDHSLAFYAEGNITHLFKNRQMRSFDFCGNGVLSRYMLLKEMVQQGNTFQYTGNLINGINFATRPVDVSIAIKGDVSAKLSYRSPCIIADLGLNFYGKMREHLSFVECTSDKLYAIKGTEGVCALDYATEGTTPPVMIGPLVEKISLNASQSRATIRVPGPTDHPQEIIGAAPTDIVVTALSKQTGSIEAPGVIRAMSSNPPVLVSVNDLHKETGTMPAEATYKVFGYLGYNFYACDWCYSPYVGIGGEVEFDARACSERTALNQWSVWAKGGFEF